ncbi:hypothetical protein DEO72_LG10g1590 [Vigna unguiculata]|uniref:Uncharacterized protein n=1 Tax=Vigna unguiculata TaxID=3917 RepID=A0A4D6N944_VIGUN|nr:hypothetical protein DEO72_LG10g1590 [Vigna unguiculata]
MGGGQRQRYWKDVVTTPIGSGTTTEVEVATGGDNGDDYDDAFGGEKLRFAIGEASDCDTGRRPSWRRLGMAR